MLVAAFAGERAPMLGISVAIFQLFEVASHCVHFPLSSGKWVNPGVVTSLLVFLPLAVQFLVLKSDTFSHTDWGAGVAIAVAVSCTGVIGVIFMMRNWETPYIAPQMNTYREQGMGHMHIVYADDYPDFQDAPLVR
jgi:hypothetical protein